MKSYLMGSAPAVRAFQRAYDEYQGTQKRLAEAELDERLLGAALDRVRSVLSVLQAFARRICSILDGLAGGVDPALGEGIQFQPLEPVFCELAGAAKRGNVPGIRAFLPCTAAALTIRSLARLIGADADAQGIARRVADSPLFESPFWGGQTPRREPVLSLVVLPPVAHEVCRDVTEAMARYNNAPTLVSSDSLAAGASVVKLDIYEVSAASDLFPRPYRCALKEISSGGDLYALSRRAREFIDSMAGEGRFREA